MLEKKGNGKNEANSNDPFKETLRRTRGNQNAQAEKKTTLHSFRVFHALACLCVRACVHSGPRGQGTFGVSPGTREEIRTEEKWVPSSQLRLPEVAAVAAAPAETRLLKSSCRGRIHGDAARDRWRTLHAPGTPFFYFHPLSSHVRVLDSDVGTRT